MEGKNVSVACPILPLRRAGFQPCPERGRGRLKTHPCGGMFFRRPLRMGRGGQCGTGFHAVGRVVVVGRYDRGLCGKRLLLRVFRIAVDEGVPFLVVGFFGLALPPIGDGVAAGGR